MTGLRIKWGCIIVGIVICKQNSDLPAYSSRISRFISLDYEKETPIIIAD